MVHSLRRLCFVFVAILVLAGVCCAAGASKLDRIPHVKKKLDAGEPIVILGLGDSITTHFGNYCRNRRYFRVPLQVSYYGTFAGYLKMLYPDAQIKLINKAIGGETANRGLARVDKDVIPNKPDLVFVMYGANDGRGGRSEEQYGKELETIVTKIKKTGADVILIAPTMSLVDLAWLLPFRQRVLSLAQKLDTPVLDGTLAIWPVDEDVNNLREVHNYLARHFPHYGDDIHPWYPGHVQMGRRLYEQLTEGIPTKPLALKISRNRPFSFPGKITFTLELKNISSKPYKGTAEIFFPYKLEVAGLRTVTEELANRATGNRLALPELKLDLAPGAVTKVNWTMRVPAEKNYDPEGALGKFVNGVSGVGVAVFSKKYNYVDFIRPTFYDAEVTVTTPRQVDSKRGVPVTVNVKNISEKAISGKLFFPGKDARDITLDAGASRLETYTLSLPENTDALRLNGQVKLQDNRRGIYGMKSIALEAVACAGADKRKVAVDGELTDWQGAVWHSIPTNPQSNMSFAVARDEKNLIFAFKAVDQFLSFGHKKIWTGEGFELYLDTRSQNELGTSGPNFQLGFFPPSKPDGKVKVVKGMGATHAQAKMVTAAWKRNADGYVIEASIPVEAFSAKPLAEGQVIGLGVGCNDSPKEGEKRKQYHWVGSKYNFCDPKDYGLLKWGEAAPLWRVNAK